jgi:hypothetical protein
LKKSTKYTNQINQIKYRPYKIPINQSNKVSPPSLTKQIKYRLLYLIDLFVAECGYEDEPLEINKRSCYPVAVGAEPHASSEPQDQYLELDSSCETSENVYRDNPRSPVSSKTPSLYEHHTIYPTFLLKAQCASKVAFARLADIWRGLESFRRTLRE